MVTHCRGVHGGRPTDCARNRPPPRQRNICGAIGRPKQKLYVRRGRVRSRPHYDELQTFRLVTEQRRYCQDDRREDLVRIRSDPFDELMEDSRRRWQRFDDYQSCECCVFALFLAATCCCQSPERLLWTSRKRLLSRYPTAHG